MKELAQEFLAQKCISIVGVTRETKGWGRTLYNEFKKRGYDTYALNPNAMAPEGIRCYDSLSKLPTKVDGVLLIMSPRVTDGVVREVTELDVPRVWINKGAGDGAVSESAIQFCKENNIAIVYGVCPFMYLQPQGFGHKLLYLRQVIGWIAKGRVNRAYKETCNRVDKFITSPVPCFPVHKTTCLPAYCIHSKGGANVHYR